MVQFANTVGKFAEGYNNGLLNFADLNLGRLPNVEKDHRSVVFEPGFQLVDINFTEGVFSHFAVEYDFFQFLDSWFFTAYRAFEIST